MRIRKTLQAPQAGFQQGARAASVASRVVVKSRGDLDDPLQERLLRFGRAQPDFLPGFMGFEKAAGIEPLDPAEKCVLRRAAGRIGFS